MIVLDTHVLVWWAAGGDRLSARAARTIRAALRKAPVAVSAISILEIATAVRRGRLVLSRPVEAWLEDVRALPELHLEPVSAAIAARAGLWGEDVPGDPADRLIAATALSLSAVLVTADRNLARARVVKTLW
ncbi:MAG: type II toxin-antitoxin system VapC family toxin [Alphaproteobacteria bacterium]